MRGVGGVKKRGALALLLWAAMALLLTGCLFRPPDELSRRPERSAGYDQLAAAIRSVKTGLEGQFGVSCEDAVIVAGDNTASIQLLPTTVASVRAAFGSAAPFDILPAVWISSLASVTVGLLTARLLSRRKGGPA